MSGPDLKIPLFYLTLEGSWDKLLLIYPGLEPSTELVLSESIIYVWYTLYYINVSGSLELVDPLPVFYDTCHIDGNRVNCANACRREKDVFASWQTMWTCFVFMALSISTEVFPKLNGSSYEFIDAVNQSLVIDISEFNSTKVLDAAFSCAAASCKGDIMGNCSTPSKPPTLDFNYTSDGYYFDTPFYWMYQNLTSVCDNLSGNFNSDIAGPGVVVSYITQISLGLFGWTLVWIFQIANWVNQPLKIFGVSISLHRSIKKGLDKLCNSRVADATKTFIVELHEAQCFFIFSIGAAILYANSQPAEFSSADTWQSMVLNRGSVQILSGMGSWPVVLVQLSLMRARMSSTYLLGLSTMTILISGIAAARGLKLSPDEIYEKFKDENKLPECGDRPSMRTFCLGISPDDLGFYLKYSATYIYISSPPNILSFLSIIGILWITALARKGPWVQKDQWFTKYSIPLLKNNPRNLSRVKKASKLIGLSLCFLGEIWAFVCIVYSLLGIRNFMNFTLQVSSNSWSIGQIITMLVWMPVISKYLYLIICGIENGFIIRLSDRFVIRKRTSLSVSRDSRAIPDYQCIPETRDEDNYSLVDLSRLPTQEEHRVREML